MSLTLLIDPNTGTTIRIDQDDADLMRDLLTDGWKPLRLTQQSSRPTHDEQNPSYRNAMKDAGRGRLLP